MRIAITGATGFIGSHLGPLLQREGHVVIPVSRKATTDGIQWDPARGALDAAALEGVDAVIHLAGEGLADKRWTDARKQDILESRTQPTDLLSRTLASLREPPRVLVSMSAVGIYGDSGDRLVTEDAPVGDDFLAQVCRAWEAAADPARTAGIRVVHPRMGVVLSPDGGALRKMLPPFRLGLGGRLGDGEQWMSWIAIDDALAGLSHCLEDGELHGPVNLTAPEPVTNREFTTTLARTLHRPAIIPVPKLALRVLFGELAEATLLTGQRVIPAGLQGSGFEFTHYTLAGALRYLLGTT